MKNKEDIEYAEKPKVEQETQSKVEENPAASPINTGKAPVKGNPDPASHYKFRQPKVKR